MRPRLEGVMPAPDPIRIAGQKKPPEGGRICEGEEATPRLGWMPSTSPSAPLSSSLAFAAAAALRASASCCLAASMAQIFRLDGGRVENFVLRYLCGLWRDPSDQDPRIPRSPRNCFDQLLRHCRELRRRFCRRLSPFVAASTAFAIEGVRAEGTALDSRAAPSHPRPPCRDPPVDGLFGLLPVSALPVALRRTSRRQSRWPLGRSRSGLRNLPENLGDVQPARRREGLHHFLGIPAFSEIFKEPSVTLILRCASSP